MPDTADTRIAVRATINLPGLKCGAVAIIDPAEPYIAEALASEFLVPVPASLEREA